MLCGLRGGFQRFGGTYYLHLQGSGTLVSTDILAGRHNPADQHRDSSKPQGSLKGREFLDEPSVCQFSEGFM